MRYWKRILVSLSIAVIISLSFVTSVFAAVGDVDNLKAIPSNTSISLTWTIASGSTSTVIRYDTSDYPATPASGTSGYSGSSNNTIITGLTAGTNYYICAWGYDGVDYSSTEAQVFITTNATSALDSGDDIPTPELPSNITVTPSVSGWNFEPFTGIMTYFTEDGLGMPTNNAWEGMALMGLLVGGVIIYIKWRNFFAAFIVVFIASIMVCGLGIMSGWIVGAEIITGLGIFAIEHNYQ